MENNAKYNEIGDFLQKTFLNNANLVDLSRALGVSYTYLNRVFAGEEFPKYKILVNLISCLNLPESKIREEADTNGMIMFYYWDNLYPDEKSLEYLGPIIRNEVDTKKISRKDMCAETGIRLNYYYSIETMESTISYEVLCLISKYIGISPCELMKKLLNKAFLKDIFALSTILKNNRINKGWDEETASTYLGIPVSKYVRLENGKGKIAYKYLEKLSKVYELNFDNLLKTVYFNNLLSNPLPSIEDYSFPKKNTSRKIKTNILNKYIKNLLQYEKITVSIYGQRTYSFSTNTLLTLFYLILTNETKTRELHKNEILFYLKNRKSTKLICDDMIKSSGFSVEKNQIEEIFEYYKDYYLYSYSEIGTFANVSKASVHQLYRKGVFQEPYTLDKVFGIIGIPSSVGYEYQFRKDKEDLIINGNIKKRIKVEEIIKDLKEKNVWLFYKNKYSSAYLVKVLETITNINLSPIEVYMELKRINNDE